MVSFRNMGRMGNFLFQAATSYAYSRRYGLNWTPPIKTNDKYWNPIYLQHLARPMPVKPNIVIKEQGHAFQELPFEESWRDKNIILDGYWQSEKYFIEFAEDIRLMFNHWEGVSDCRTSIHIRLGDYKMYPEKHPVVSEDFYCDAVKMVVERTGCTKFRVFSDEPREARKIIEHQLFYGCEFEFMNGNNEVTDLKLISECSHHINSSSTFAWWGAWLNPNPHILVITPKLWFVPGHGGLNTDDIIPESWIKL